MRIISSGSVAEMPQAYMTFLPVRCSRSRIIGMIALSRASKRRIGGRHQLLVVLDEIDIRLDHFLDQGGRFRRAKAQARA